METYRQTDEYKLRIQRDLDDVVPEISARAAEMKGPPPGDPDVVPEPVADDGAPSRQDLFMAKVHAAQEAMKGITGGHPMGKPPPLDGDMAALGAAAARALADAAGPEGLFPPDEKKPVSEKKKAPRTRGDSDSDDDRRARKKKKRRHRSSSSESDRRSRRRRR